MTWNLAQGSGTRNWKKKTCLKWGRASIRSCMCLHKNTHKKNEYLILISGNDFFDKREKWMIVHEKLKRRQLYKSTFLYVWSSLSQNNNFWHERISPRPLHKYFYSRETEVLNDSANQKYLKLNFHRFWFFNPSSQHTDIQNVPVWAAGCPHTWIASVSAMSRPWNTLLRSRKLNV